MLVTIYQVAFTLVFLGSFWLALDEEQKKLDKRNRKYYPKNT